MSLNESWTIFGFLLKIKGQKDTIHRSIVIISRVQEIPYATVGCFFISTKAVCWNKTKSLSLRTKTIIFSLIESFEINSYKIIVVYIVVLGNATFNSF